MCILMIDMKAKAINLTAEKDVLSVIVSPELNRLKPFAHYAARTTAQTPRLTQQCLVVLYQT